jgi:hypothetical protein
MKQIIRLIAASIMLAAVVPLKANILDDLRDARAAFAASQSFANAQRLQAL